MATLGRPKKQKKTYEFRLQEVRERMELKKSQVARLCGVSAVTIDSYERGRFEPSLQTLLQLVCGLGLSSLDELVAFDRQQIKKMIAESDPLPIIEDPEIKNKLQAQPA